MEDGRKNNGGARKGAGRKPKSVEDEVKEKLKPYTEEAIKALVESIKDKQGWAIKMYFEYFYGKPKEIKQEENQVIETPKLEVKIIK